MVSNSVLLEFHEKSFYEIFSSENFIIPHYKHITDLELFNFHKKFISYQNRDIDKTLSIWNFEKENFESSIRKYFTPINHFWILNLLFPLSNSWIFRFLSFYELPKLIFSFLSHGWTFKWDPLPGMLFCPNLLRFFENSVLGEFGRVRFEDVLGGGRTMVNQVFLLENQKA